MRRWKELIITNWATLGELGTQDVHDRARRRGIAIINRALAVALLFVTVNSIIYVAAGYHRLLWPLVSLAAFFSVGTLLTATGHHLIGRSIALVGANLVIAGSALATGPETGTTIYFTATMVSPFLMFSGPDRKWAIPHALFAASLLVSIHFGWLSVPPLVNIDPDTARMISVLQFIGNASVITLEVLISISQVERGEEELEHAYEALVRELRARSDAEDMVRDQRAALVNISRLSEMAEMAAGIAHEINSPLTIIDGRIRQIRRLEVRNAPDRFPELIDSIGVASTRIAKIVHGLRVFARDGSKDPYKQEAIRDILDDAVGFSSERLSNHGVELEQALPSNDFRIECRSVEIAQVLLNLINNAFDAVCTLPDDQAKWIRVQAEARDDSVLISVSDSGPGIPEKVAERIMQPFYTTKELGKGTGLGLSISRGIIESHGGRIWYDREERATCFKIWLPKKQAQAAA